MDREMIERAAEAVWEAEPNVGHWCDWADLVGDPEHAENLALAAVYRRHATAAIAAVADQLREQGVRAGIEAAAAAIQSDWPHDKRVLVPMIRALDATAIARGIEP